jgi:hypothetical protein
MDLKAAEYFRQKFESGKLFHKNSWAQLHACVIRVMTDNVQLQPRGFPTRPVLPPNFGMVVDE